MAVRIAFQPPVIYIKVFCEEQTDKLKHSYGAKNGAALRCLFVLFAKIHADILSKCV